MALVLDPGMVRNLADKITGDGAGVQYPSGPSGQAVVYRQGVVQSLDTTNFVALCTIGGGSTNVPVMVLNGAYPVVGQTVVIGVFGQSYYLLGPINTTVPIGGLAGHATGPSTSFNAASGNIFTASVPVIHGAKYLVHAYALGAQQTAPATITFVNCATDDSVLSWRVWNFSPATGAELGAGSAKLYTPAATRTTVFTFSMTDNAGTFSISANACEINVVRVA